MDSDHCRLHVLDTGYCWASEHHIRSGAPRRRVRCHALVALYHHPTEGWILFDTGYAPRFLEVTRRFPQSLYRRVLPVEIPSESSVVRQLPGLGLQVSDIRHVIVSHFHGDHVAGLLDFPEATIVCARSAYEHLRGRRGVRALAKAYLPDLVPADLPQRADWIADFPDDHLPGIGATRDLFGDGLLRIVSLPGHSRGQIGAVVRVEESTFFLVADGCWQRDAYRLRQPPHWLTHLFVDNVDAMHRTLTGIGEFHRACPRTVIVPTHCPEARAELVAHPARIQDVRPHTGATG